MNKTGIYETMKYEIKATSSYVRYMQIETPISFKPWDRRMVRNFLKDIIATSIILKRMFFVGIFDIGQISDL